MVTAATRRSAARCDSGRRGDPPSEGKDPHPRGEGGAQAPGSASRKAPSSGPAYAPVWTPRWWGAPLLGNDTSLVGPGAIPFRGLSLRTEAAVRVSSPGCVVWEPWPPRMVSGRPGRPGLLPGAEVQASSGSGNHPGGGRGPLGMPVTGRKVSERKLTPVSSLHQNSAPALGWALPGREVRKSSSSDPRARAAS